VGHIHRRVQNCNPNWRRRIEVRTRWGSWGGGERAVIMDLGSDAARSPQWSSGRTLAAVDFEVFGIWNPTECVLKQPLFISFKTSSLHWNLVCYQLRDIGTDVLMFLYYVCWMFIGKSQTNSSSNVGNSGTCPTWQLSSLNFGRGSNAIGVPLMQTLRLTPVGKNSIKVITYKNSSNGVNKYHISPACN